MDIEKLIKRIKCPQIQSCPMDGEYPSCKACQKSIQQEVITALSMLRAENEELRAKLKQVKAERDAESSIEHYKHMACNMAFICQLMKQEGAERNSGAGRQWWQRYE